MCACARESPFVVHRRPQNRGNESDRKQQGVFFAEISFQYLRCFDRLVDWLSDVEVGPGGTG